MAIFELFSKNQKRLRGEVLDIYIYDNIPEKLRVQIIHIIKDCIGKKKDYGDNLPAQCYQFIFDILCREYGKFNLVSTTYTYEHSPEEQLLNFLLRTENVEEVLDVVQLVFQYIDKIIQTNYYEYTNNTDVDITPQNAISDLNERFKENGVGYSFEGSKIIRIDSTYIHSEITKPTITLLSNKEFQGANEEYLKAHDHYKHGRNKECLTECLKAFESTLKGICQNKSWPYNQTDTAKKLIQICFQNNLVPTFTQNQFTSLQNLLESGIPTIRNKLGGHGQGHIPQTVDDEMTRYALNLTGSNIIFLIEQSRL